jgi:hypothetical protein
MAEAASGERWHRWGFELFGRYTQRFVGLIRSLDDTQAKARVAGLDWTAAETAAHVCSLYRRLTVDPRRAPDYDALIRQNAEDVAAIGTDLGAVADEIEQRLAAAGGLVDALSPEQEFEFHLGQKVTLASGMGVLVGELLAHGDDIARATGARWEPSGDDLEILWRVTMPVLAGWLRPASRELDEAWELRFSWKSGPVLLHLHEGQVAIDEPLARPPDHVVDIDDTVEFTLAFPYGRRPVADPAVARLASLFDPV